MAAETSHARAIIVLARAPSSLGKTRLTAHLPADQARGLREALFLDTLAVARSLDVPVTVAYTPDAARDEMAALVGELSAVDRRQSTVDRGPWAVGRGPWAGLRPQCGDDLGARMHHAIGESFKAGVEHVVLIGSDLPTLPSAHLVEAFARLESGIDCVFGPAGDGGYYLVGVRRGSDFARVFTGISWGTNRVLQESLSVVQAAGLKTVLIDPWFDVDRPEDLQCVVNDSYLAEGRRALYRRFLP